MPNVDTAANSTSTGVFQRSEKEQKLDRQLRLWGAHGQEKLEAAHICVLGSAATASETLKNLVLPNVGAFTLIDDTLVTKADGNSFFVPHDSIGQLRSKVVTASLLQLNPDCNGNFTDAQPSALVNGDLNYFKQFSIVVDCSLGLADRLKLSSFLYELSIPFLHVQTNGLLGLLRLQVQEQCIVEDHSGNKRDLYVHPDQISKWPQLQEYVDQFDLKDCSDELKHSKVPYVAILAQSIKTYMAQNDGNLPKTWDQKKAYKASIGEYRNQDAAVSEENFDEAVEFARFAYILPKLLPDTQAVLDDPAAQTATKDSDLFWVCARAVNEWRAAEGAGLLPVSTDVPDMASTTTDYIALKKVFKAKAAADAAAILDRVVKLVGVDRYAAEAQTIDAYARYFVANVRYLRVVRTDSIAQEFEAKTFNTEALTEYLQEYFYDADPSQYVPLQIHWYLAFRMSALFEAKYGHLPGSGSDASCKEDTANLVQLQKAFYAEYGVAEDVAVEEKVLAEFTRYGGIETHNTAAAMGGIASQAILKLLLKQFVPLSTNLVYNGIHGMTQVYNLVKSNSVQ